MAIYSLHTEPASRSNGKNAIAMAAYRCAGRLINEITGQICDYTRKLGVIAKTIIFPEGVKFDRQNLWNMAERAEKRKDSRIAREIRIALPHELSQEMRKKLAYVFAKHLVKKYNIAVDLSLHQPDRQGDNRNFHAHLLLTTRQITLDGLGEKSNLERDDKFLKKHGLKNGKEQIKEIREEWEYLCNLALEREGKEERISAKSYKKRGIDREPTIHLGPKATAMERRGIETEKGTWNRIIEKNNLRRIIQKEIDRIQRFYEALNGKILSIKNEISKRISYNIRTGIQIEHKQKTIEELLDNNSKMPDKNQELSIDDVLRRHQYKQKQIDNTRQLSIDELLKRTQINRESYLKRDKDGIER